MAGGSLFALIDKIAVVLDDVALMTKVAAKKTAGVLGDDLALNAQQVSGVSADRELPVVFAVAKGSAINKLILVPTALLISATLPLLITPLLMIGGAYLCFEGAEKIVHSLSKSPNESNEEHQQALDIIQSNDIDILSLEQDKIKGAIRTDFILSAEIIVIALGTVQNASLMDQVIVVSLIAAIMTVGVYGLVAGIVKLDDAGLYLLKQRSTGVVGKLKQFLGQSLLSFAPKLMRSLSVIGTAAMFLVGGSILLHGIPQLHHFIDPIMAGIDNVSLLGGSLVKIVPLIIDAIIGLVTGSLVLLVVTLIRKLLKR